MGLSREKVAAHISVSSKTIERWENGVTLAPRWQLVRLAELYDVAIETLEAEAAA